MICIAPACRVSSIRRLSDCVPTDCMRFYYAVSLRSFRDSGLSDSKRARPAAFFVSLMLSAGKVGFSMLRYIVKRLLAALAVIFAVSLITFAVLNLIPGNMAQLMLGPEATPEKVRELELALGLDKPWYLQYLSWLKGFLTFDWGTSYLYGSPVRELIFQRLPVTISLTVFATILATVAAVLLGVLSAIKKNSVLDYFCRSVMQLGSALPAFWLGMLFIVYFGLQLKWFPVKGYVSLSQGFIPYLKSITLPGVVLAIGEVGLLLRTVRTAMLSELKEDFVDMARAKGLPARMVYGKYALRGAMIAPLNVIGIQFAKLIGGSIVVESVFSMPGLGRLVLTAVEQRDIILLQGSVMFITTLVVLISLAVDIIVMLLNPQIRYHMQGVE